MVLSYIMLSIFIAAGLTVLVSGAVTSSNARTSKIAREAQVLGFVPSPVCVSILLMGPCPSSPLNCTVTLNVGVSSFRRSRTSAAVSSPGSIPFSVEKIRSHLDLVARSVLVIGGAKFDGGVAVQLTNSSLVTNIVPILHPVLGFWTTRTLPMFFNLTETKY